MSGLKRFLNINDIAQNSNNLQYLNNEFDILDRLNSLLKTALPKHLSDYCRVGAVDNKKNLVVVFVINQEVFHLIRNLGNHILQTFANSHFAFEQILIRVQRSQRTQSSQAKYKKPEPKLRLSLVAMATSIGKPELVLDPNLQEPHISEQDIIIW